MKDQVAAASKSQGAEGGSGDPLHEDNRRLQAALAEAEREIDELSEELEEKAMALAAARAEAPPPPPVAQQRAPQPQPQPSQQERPGRFSSLIRSAHAAGSSQSRMRAASLEEELGRQAERHAVQIAEMEAHFVARLAEVAGAGEAAVFEALEKRIVELEKERADPPLLSGARATISRLQAELEELRAENRFLSSEVERWASLAQEKP